MFHKLLWFVTRWPFIIIFWFEHAVWYNDKGPNYYLGPEDYPIRVILMSVMTWCTLVKLGSVYEREEIEFEHLANIVVGMVIMLTLWLVTERL